MISQKMINLRLPILVSAIFFIVFMSSFFMFPTPSSAARVGHSLVQEDEPEIPEVPEVPELPLPEEPEVPDEPEDPEEPEEPEEPEVPEEPEEPPKDPEEPKFEFPSWIPTFPLPGANGGFPKNEKQKPMTTVKEVAVKSSSVSEESSSGSVSNKKPQVNG